MSARSVSQHCGHAEKPNSGVARGRTAALIKSGKLPDVSIEKCQKNYKKALEKGVLKILSKMGISLLSCYHGAQIFEIYGLGKEVVDFAFKGSVSRIGGMSLADLQREAESFWVKVQDSHMSASYTFFFVLALICCHMWHSHLLGEMCRMQWTC